MDGMSDDRRCDELLKRARRRHLASAADGNHGWRHVEEKGQTMTRGTSSDGELVA